MMNQTKTASNNKVKDCLSIEESGVVKCLLYFDTFNYPLTFEEIYCFCGVKIKAENELHTIIKSLLSRDLIKHKDLFYFVNADESIIERRLKGNLLAQKVMPKALRYGRFIAQFPFVETVCISGSLSKNYFDENGDVDFFIVTKPQRLWLCRSILVGFKKIFLFNSRKYFCVNYFVGSDNLNIPDCNAFTATEIASLIPVYNLTGYSNFIKENHWIYNYLPNFNLNAKKTTLNTSKTFVKKSCEWFLGGSIGNFLDKQFFKLTLFLWQKKFSHFNKSDFDLNMRSRKNVSKHHPNGFQQKVLKHWAHSKENYCNNHHLIFSDL